jgi:hypothetical protein
LLTDNPYTTLQILLEPRADPTRLTPDFLELLRRECYRESTYLDRYFSMHPGPPRGAKHLVVWLPAETRDALPPAHWETLEPYATLLEPDPTPPVPTSDG